MTSVQTGLVDDWLDKLDQLNASDRDGSLYEHLISVASRQLGASGGAIWCVTADEHLEVLAQVGLGMEPVDRIHETWIGHDSVLHQVLQSGRPQTVSARLEHESGQAKTLRPLTLLVAPFHVDDSECEAVIELFFFGAHSEFSTDEFVDSLHEFCRLAVAARQGDSRGSATSLPSEAVNFARFCSRIHETLDLRASADSIVREARTWMGCSRVSVFQKRGRRCRLLAMSDMQDFDRRSRALRAVEQAAATVARRSEPVWKDGCDGAHDQDMNRFPDGVAASDWMIAAIPLARHEKSGDSVIGVLWVENFDRAGVWTDDRRRKVELAASQASLALTNAMRHREVPLHRLGRGLQYLGWRKAISLIPKWLLAAAVIGGTTAGLTLIETDFDISGRGALRPRVQQDVFARVNGIVQKPAVQHGDTIEAGADLLRLRNPDLEKERAELEGRIRTTQQQIADLDLLRAGGERREERETSGQIELAIRKAELTAILQNLQGQEAALSRYEQELNLTSPISGVVLTWDVEQLLEGRWVPAGERLLTVANLNGPWIVEIRVPDRDIEHVLAAQESSDPLTVTFVTATELETEHVGTIVDIAKVVEHDPLDGPVVVVTVDVENADAIKRQPGSSVYSRIHCGRRSIGYVWFRRLYEAAVSWISL